MIVMVKIKAFKALRPKKVYVEKVASPPYDVINTEEARELAKHNPYSFLHVVKPEIDLDENIYPYDDLVYKTGKINLDKLIKGNVLVHDEEDKLYIYQQVMGNHTQTGLVACSSVDDYINGKIKKHELTREVKEKDRIKHVYTLNANTGPVFLTYKAVPTINELIEQVVKSQPVYDFESVENIRHVFWTVENKNMVNMLIKEFEKLDCVYVADGHHRSASAAKVRDMKKNQNPKHTGNEEYNYFLSVLFPHEQLSIMPYNRVVKDLNNLTVSQFLEAISRNFDVAKYNEKSPSKIHVICMYLDKTWYTLTAKPHTIFENDPVKSLDVSILQDYILTPLLGIQDPRKCDKIDFIGGIKGTKKLEDLVDNGNFKIAFSMYPTSITQLISIADAGKIMPPKSTWFEPKLKSGLVTHLFG